MDDYVFEGLVSDVLFAAVEGGEIRRGADEWSVEHMAAFEEGVHPLAPFDLRHDPLGVVDARGLGLRRDLLGLANIFAL